MTYLSERRLENMLSKLKEGIGYKWNVSHSWNASRYINSEYLDFFTIDEDGDPEELLFNVRLADHINKISKVDYNLVADNFNFIDEEEYNSKIDEDCVCENDCECPRDYEQYIYDLELEAETYLLDELEEILIREGVLN